MALVHILAVGWDPAVLSSRCSVLRYAGYLVRSASSIDETIQGLSQTDFDLVLLCHSIPVPDRDRLIKIIRSAYPQIPIYLVASASSDSETGLVDGILSGRPEDLLKALSCKTASRSLQSSISAKQHQPDELED